MRARADADAMLLRAPRVLVEAIRFPSSHRLDLGPTVGSNLQARVGLSFSPLDFYRGGVLADLGEADCRAHDAGERARARLVGVTDAGRIAALRAQADYLDAHRAEWRQLLGTAVEQFDARVITAVELHELRHLTEALERKAAAVRGEAERLEAHAPATPASVESTTALVSDYVALANGAEHAQGRLRALDAWTFKVMGGVIPLPGQPVDWFGIAELSYSLGDVASRHALARAEKARADELGDPYELPARFEDARRELVASLSSARRELDAVEAELRTNADTRAMLQRADAPNLTHARSTLVIERFDAESDRVFLSTLVTALAATNGDQHGS